MKTFNTPELVNTVAERMGVYKKDVAELLTKHLPAVIAENVKNGNKVHLAGLGTFYPGRGKKQLRVKFKPSATLVNRINNDNE